MQWQDPQPGPCLIAEASWHLQASPDCGHELSYSLRCSAGFIDPMSFSIFFFLRLIPFCGFIPSCRLLFATENSS